MSLLWTSSSYRGRLAPSPTGFLHLGHARTFWTAQQRARAAGGTLVLRMEDLDGPRCQPHFVAAVFEDLRWFGFEWAEGPDCGGPFAPYTQSERMAYYRDAFKRLQDGGFIYPCICSRKDIFNALSAPHAGDEEPIYPGTCRPRPKSLRSEIQGSKLSEAAVADSGLHSTLANRVSWRFQVPDGETIRFVDGAFGSQEFAAGRDFGDFVVWRHDDFPAYQLAVVVDDAAMKITEAVRGADLLLSTARQLLLYRALGYAPPSFYHCPLLQDDHGTRLAKRNDALSLRRLREQGATPQSLIAQWVGCR